MYQIFENNEAISTYQPMLGNIISPVKNVRFLVRMMQVHEVTAVNKAYVI